MAQATNTVTLGDAQMKEYFCASVFTNDVNPSSANLVVKAAPSDTALSNFLDRITIITDATAVTITLLDDTDIVIGPFLTTTAEMSGIYTFDFIRPIKFSGAINVKAGADEDIAVVAQGFVGK